MFFYSNRLVYGNYSVIVDFEIFILTESGNVLGYVCTAVRTNGLHFAGSVFGGLKYGFPITVCVGKSVYDLGENLMVAILALEVLGKTGFGAGGSLRFSKDVLLVTECINGLLSYLVSLAVGAEFTVGETAFDTSGRLAGYRLDLIGGMSRGINGNDSGSNGYFEADRARFAVLRACGSTGCGNCGDINLCMSESGNCILRYCNGSATVALLTFCNTFFCTGGSLCFEGYLVMTESGNSLGSNYVNVANLTVCSALGAGGLTGCFDVFFGLLCVRKLRNNFATGDDGFTNRTLFACIASFFGTRSFNRFDRLSGVTLCRNGLLGGYNLTAIRALLTFGKSGFGTGSLLRRIGSKIFMLAFLSAGCESKNHKHGNGKKTE